MCRRVAAGSVAVAVVVTLAVGGWFAWASWQRTSYQQGVAWLPESTLRATWTHWAQVRDLADGDDLDDRSSDKEVSDFLSRAYDLDLTATSAVVEASSAMHDLYGFSPVNAEWEMFGQSREGAVAMLRLPESADLEQVEANLERLGYTAPNDGAGSGSGRVWAGSTDLVASLDPTLSAVMENVVVLPEQRVVLLSDDREYAAASAEVVAGDTDGLGEVEGTSDLAAAVGEPANAVLLASDFACEALGMATADPGDRAVAEELVDAAGGVSPLAGLVMARDESRSLVVGMHFESSAQASEDLRPRVDLASGDAPGQGGSFAERFRVVEAVAEGSEIVMQLEPVDHGAPVLSDLTQGPLLFASC